MEHEEKLCDEVETIREFKYLGDRVSTSGGCLAAVTSITRCLWVMLRECGELMYDRRFPLWMVGAVYESYIGSAMLYRSEVWFLNESKVGILQST